MASPTVGSHLAGFEVEQADGDSKPTPSGTQKTDVLFLMLYMSSSIGMNVFMKVCFSKLPIAGKAESISVSFVNGLPTPFFWTMTQQCVSFMFVIAFLLCWRLSQGRFGYQPKTAPQQAWKSVALLSGIFAANIGLNNLSLELLSLTMNSVIRATSAVWTAFAGRLLFKHGKTTIEWICLWLGSLCCVAAVLLDRRADGAEKQFVTGVLICVASTFCGALMFVVVEFFGTSVKLTGLDQTCYMSLPVALLMLPAVFLFPHEVSHSWAEGAPKRPVHDAEILGMLQLGWQVWGMVFLSGLFAFLYNCIQFFAIQRLSPVTTACASNGSKALTVLFSMLFLESHTWFSALSMLVAVAGVVAAFTCYSVLESRRRSGGTAAAVAEAEGHSDRRLSALVCCAAVAGAIFGLSLFMPDRAGGAGALHGPTAPSEFPSLGVGRCLDQRGWYSSQAADDAQWRASTVGKDGRSGECEALCSQAETCVGVMTNINDGGRCVLLTSPGFLPSDADGTNGFQCFWRHQWLYATQLEGVSQAVPRIIWSYWATSAVSQKQQRFLTEGAHSGRSSGSIPPFVSLAVKSWQALNPDHTVRFLDQVTVKDWVPREELPQAFEHMDPPHQADAVRLAVLVRHGGIWLDASSLMLRPLADLMGPRGDVRPFFYLDRRPPDVRERRDDGKHYLESSFLTAPPGDVFLSRSQTCFNQAFKELAAGERFRPLEVTGLFTQRQMEMAWALQTNGYLTIIACFFKALDEDAGLAKLWRGPHISLRSAWDGIFPQLRFGSDWSRLFLQGGPGSEELASLLLNTSLLLKLRSEDRRPLDHLSEHELRCQPGVIRAVLQKIGLGNETCP